MNTIKFLRLLFLLAILATIAAQQANADSKQTDNDQGADKLSSYWSPSIQQWEKQIMHWSAQKELDPDLIAAVMYKESLGQPDAEYYGAVGLMMIMPSEYGFSWRPTTQELFNPNVNVKWGTNILAQIIRDSGGELANSLAAYNGGWEQTHIPSTRRYAQSVLTHYALAIAGHSEQDISNWTMLVITRADGELRKIWTTSSGDYVAPCFANQSQIESAYPDWQSWLHTNAAHFTDLGGHDVVIDVWLSPGNTNNYMTDTMAGVTLPLSAHIGNRP